MKKKINDERTRYKFTLPGLKPGCCDSRFVIRSTSRSWLLMRDWEFQYSEPALWSEYQIVFPIGFGYAAVHQGYVPYVIHTKWRSWPPFFRIRLGNVRRRLCEMHADALGNKGCARIAREPFVTSMEDYIRKPGYNWRDIHRIWASRRIFFTDWSMMIDNLLERRIFRREDRSHRKDRATHERDHSSDERSWSKVAAIYDWIARSIYCSGSRGYGGRSKRRWGFWNRRKDL